MNSAKRWNEGETVGLMSIRPFLFYVSVPSALSLSHIPPPPTVIWVIFVPKIFYQQADRRSHAKKLLNTWNRQLNLLLCVRATGGRGVVVGGVGVGGRFSPLREETRTLSCRGSVLSSWLHNPQPFYGLTSQTQQSSSSWLSNIRHSSLLDNTTSASHEN